MNFKIAFGSLSVVALLCLLVSQKEKSLADTAFQEQQQKTQYMQLCADEGISAFNCLNNWMMVSSDGR